MGLLERLRVPKEEADYRRRTEIPPRLCYWEEAEVRDWRRRLREEKERVERESRERLEWRVREMKRGSYWEDPGRAKTTRDGSYGMMTWTTRPCPCWKAQRGRP